MTARALGWSVFTVVFVVTMMRGTGEFVHDAEQYWRATWGLLGLPVDAPAGYWDMRGVLTAVVFTPAAAASALLGAHWAGFAVLVQNSLVLAWLAAFLVPRFVGRRRPLSVTARWVGAFLIWITVSGFAPYPLIDIYASVAILAIIVLLRSHRLVVILAAGVIAGMAINLRPAYLVTIVLVSLAVLVWRRWAGLLFPAGIAIGLMPQLVFNVMRSGTWSVLPVESGSLVALQAEYASYTVRYDTILGSPTPRQFFCSPEMARLVADSPPQSAGELALTFLQTMPTSIVFSLEKLGASLHWPYATPYTVTTTGLDTVFALLVTVMAVVGAAALLYLAARRTQPGQVRDWYGTVLIGAVIVGSILTLVSSAAESRFALLLVALGAIGCTDLIGLSPRALWNQNRWLPIVCVVVTLIVVAAGYSGLSHPAPAGEATLAVCASA